MKGFSNIPSIISGGGGELTPCTVTINLDSTLPSSMATYIFAWDGTKVTQVGNTVPITFQTYVNSGFVIYGLYNTQWANVVPDIADEDWIEIWNNGDTAVIFYIFPTSSNYSITLTSI